MIKPTALWNLAHECEEEDAENLGKILLLCAGKQVTLDRAWRIHANVVLKDAADLDERVEEKRQIERERKRKYRKDSENVTPCPTVSQDVPRDTTGQDGTPRCPAPYIHTLTHSSTHPSTHSSTQTNTNRSVTVTVEGVQGERNENGTELFSIGGFVDDFKKAVSADHTGSPFFDPAHDPAVIAVALTKDKNSLRRWRQAMNNIGEGAMREELYAFYRELCAGEEPKNRGAALNARLKKLEGGK